jgi:acyl-CoA thioester hydrolase
VTDVVHERESLSVGSAGARPPGWAPATFECEVQVRFGETDAMGIAWSPNFYGWFDISAHGLFSSIGYGMPALWKRGALIPLLESGARFRAPVTFDDVITVRTTVAELRGRTFELSHTIHRDETLIATGHEVRGYARLVEREPVRLELVTLPGDLRRALGERAALDAAP